MRWLGPRFVRMVIVLACMVSQLAGQTDVLQERVDTLILQLGSSSYRERENAETELEKLGLLAFEPLQEVQNHPDIEIRLRARAMVSRLRKFFLSDGIDPIIARFVDGYPNAPTDNRNTRIQLIATLLPQQGVDVLSRIARFEDSPLLAKRAALSILEATVRVPEATRVDWLNQVREAAAISRRDATVWLRCFASVIIDAEASISEWAEIVAAEQVQLQSVTAETDADIVLRLQRLRADLLKLARRDDPLMAEMVAVPLESEEVTRDWLLWLQEREAWDAIITMAESNKPLFAGDRILMYGLAEAKLRTGDVEAAEGDAEWAFSLGGSPDDRDEAAGQEMERTNVAKFLEDERGLFDWAEREYRQAFAKRPANTIEAIVGEGTHDRYRALFHLSHMLHDRQRDWEAAKVLQQYVDDAEKTPALKHNAVQLLAREYGSIVSSMHYYYSEHYRAAGQLDKQRDHLEQGFAADPQDADLLIAMYRFAEADDEWRDKVNAAILETSALHRMEIKERQVAHERIAGSQETALAYALNQFAWLVGNTTGDGQEALRYSQRSLEIIPGDEGFLDTLARCHYNVGQLDEAIRYQEWAVQRGPHEGQLKRQLAFFRSQQK